MSFGLAAAAISAAAAVLLAAGMPVSADAAAPSIAPSANDSDAPAQGCNKGSENEGFFQRLKDSYRSRLAWNGSDPAAPSPRIVGGAEVPQSNPPWPYATWNIGGSETIGVDNMYYNALMDAFYCGKGGQKLKDSRFTIYGWVEPGANLSTSHTRFNYATGTGGEFPAAHFLQASTRELARAWLSSRATPRTDAT